MTGAEAIAADADLHARRQALDAYEAAIADVAQAVQAAARELAIKAAIIDDLRFVLADGLGALIAEFEGEPELQGRVADAVARTCDRMSAQADAITAAMSAPRN